MKAGAPDLFQTPVEALEPLLPWLARDRRIWEPACGEGNLVRGLSARGYDVTGTDILTGHDFLTWQPDAWDCSVTNPPFSIKDCWLARCYDLGRPFALLLPLTGLEGVKRQRLFRRHGLEMILMPRRIHFQTPNFTEGRKSSSWFGTAWYTHGLGIGRDLTFWTPPAAQGTLIP